MTDNTIDLGGDGHLEILGSGRVRFRGHADGLEVVLHLKDRGGRLRVTRIDVRAEVVTGQLLDQIPFARIETLANQATLAKLVVAPEKVAFLSDVYSPPSRKMVARDGKIVVEVAPLNIPTTRDYPDRFFREVADTYAAYAAHSKRPAVEMAAANGVAVTTVHRWVKEARRRGLMAPSGTKRRSADMEDDG